MKEALLGVDIGTTNCKAATYSTNGEKIVEAEIEYPTYHPKPSWAEQEPEDWFNSFVLSVREVVKKTLNLDYDILAIALSSQREGVVPVSKEGKPLSRCIIWMDERSIPQTEEIVKKIGVEEIYSKTGLRPAPTFTATKLMWLKENEPEVYKNTKVFLQPKEYIVFKITGRAVTDPSLASRTMLFNINKVSWDSELASSLDISLEKMPEILESQEVVGYIDKDIARKLNLNKSIPVINGGGDRACEALGAGLIEPGIVGETTGTATNLKLSINKVILDPKKRIVCSKHVLKDKWLLEAGTTPTGAILRWFRDNFAHEEVRKAKELGVNAYKIIDEESEKIPAGSDGLIVLPFFMGANSPRWNHKLRGLVVGLTLAHSKAHIARGIMEGIAYLSREILEVFYDLNIYIKEIVVLGGAARSDLWNKIKASVWNRRVLVPRETDAATVGSAILAGLGIGLFRSPEEGVKTMVSFVRQYEPIREWKETYENCYRKYIDCVNLFEKYFS